MKQQAPVKSFVMIAVAVIAVLAVGYKGISAYLNKSNVMESVATVSAIEPANGGTAADAGATDSVQGTVDSTATAR